VIFTDVKKWFSRFFSGSSFTKNVATLAGGTAVAQLLTILSAPVLTRVFGPDDFGLLAVYTAIVSIGGVVATLQYHRAIPLPFGGRLTSNLVALCLVLVSISGVLATLIVTILGASFYETIGTVNLEQYALLIPIGIVSVALYETTSLYAIRIKEFRRISGTRLLQSVSQNGTQLGSGLCGYGPIGLVLGQLLGQLLGFVSLAFLAKRAGGLIIGRVTAVGIIAAARRYRRFPQFTSWSAVLNTISLQAPTILLSSFFGIAVAGLFALGQQVLMMPVSLISKSASQVFYTEAVDASRSNRLNYEVRSLVIRLSRLAVPFSLTIALVSPEIFAVFFGESWRESGVYCQWQALWLFMTFLTVPLSPLVAVLERQATDTAFQFALLVGRTGAIFIGGLTQNPMIAIALFGITSGLLRGLYFGWLLKIGGVSIATIFPALLKEFAIALLTISPLLVTKVLSSSDGMTVLAAIVCGGFFVISIAYRSRDPSEEKPALTRNGN
jgi:O-antigen/teichoic acid export membrane protein